MEIIKWFFAILILVGFISLLKWWFSSVLSRGSWPYQITFKTEEMIPSFSEKGLAENICVNKRYENVVFVDSKVSENKIKKLISEHYGLSLSDFSVVLARKFFTIF